MYMKLSSFFVLSILFFTVIYSMQDNQINEADIDEQIARLQQSLRSLQLHEGISNQLQDALSDELQVEIEYFEKIKKEQKQGADSRNEQEKSKDTDDDDIDFDNDFVYHVD